MALVDPLAVLVAALQNTGMPVFVEVPYGGLEKLPVVNISPVAAVNDPSWSGVGVDQWEIDVELLGGVADWESGWLFQQAAQIRRVLAVARLPGVVVRGVSPPQWRPDVNPDVKRCAVTATVAVTG